MENNHIFKRKIKGGFGGGATPPHRGPKVGKTQDKALQPLNEI